eukprot:scaffold299279_cov39-Tisochrysis_lutea.AAC.8
MASAEQWSWSAVRTPRCASSRMRFTSPWRSGESGGASMASAQSSATSPRASSSEPPANWLPSCITSRPRAGLAPSFRACSGPSCLASDAM